MQGCQPRTMMGDFKRAASKGTVIIEVPQPAKSCAELFTQRVLEMTTTHQPAPNPFERQESLFGTCVRDKFSQLFSGKA